MRKFYLLPMAIATLALGACSNDDVTSNDGGKSSFADGGYVALSINLPSTTSTSRAANDNFDDGLASEYAVNNATLVLFSGTTEDESKFHSAYDLTTSMSMNGDNPNQITSTTKIVKQVNETNTTSSNKLYALVVLNDNGLLDVVDGSGLKVGNTTLTAGTTTFANFKALTVTNTTTQKAATNFTTNGIYMTNAPLANVAGGSQDPTSATITTLANITSDVYNTVEEARANTAANIYVERGVAKVTMSSNSGTLSGEDYAGNVKFEIDGWVLDNTNNTSYYVRNYDATWNGLQTVSSVTNPYRFIGSAQVSTTDALYRTYWGTDPNSAKPAGLETVETGDLLTTFGTNYPQYCFENTNTVANMDQDKGTRVVIRTKIYTVAAENASSAGTYDVVEGKTFYTINDDRSTIYNDNALEDRIADAVLNNQTVINWKDENSLTLTRDNMTSFSISNVTLDANGNISDPTVKVTAFTLTVGSQTFVANATENATVVDAINADLKTITAYTNGYAYYDAYIKHFGDDLTPWGEGVNGVSSSDIYPTANADRNYLGRYGVLRNNWYDLNVTGIRALGEPMVPEREDTPIDELSNYVAISINVLSWAKRNQSVEL